jgi:hypothetical protein
MASDRRGIMYERASWGHIPLAHGIGDDRHVRAACDCGAMAVIDTAMWIAEGCAGLKLSSFEERVRCGACGARRVPLQVWYGKVRPTLQTPIYVFR